MLHGIYIVVFPILGFSAIELLKPEWQSGRFVDYVILFLFPEASLIFFLLLAYCIVCYLLLLAMPERFAPSFAVRAGIYSGVLLALQYTLLEMVQRLDGSSMLINRQLQRLKCLELALRAIAPDSHRNLRRIYDRSGKWLASYIRHPYVVNLAYLSMKSGEWLALLRLKPLVPEIDGLSSTMYVSIAPTLPPGGEYDQNQCG